MVVPDPSLEPGRAAGRLDATDQSRGGERVQRFVHRLQGHVADPVAHTGGDTLDVQVVAGADGLEKRDADCRHPQAGPA
jgi:hypothetical protein